MALTEIAKSTVELSPAASLSTGAITTVADRLYMFEFRCTIPTGPATVRMTINGDTTDANYTRSRIGSTGDGDSNLRPAWSLGSGTTLFVSGYLIAVDGAVIFLQGLQHESENSRHFFRFGEVAGSTITELSFDADSGTPIDVDSQLVLYDLGTLPEVASETVSGPSVAGFSTGVVATETDKSYMALSIVKLGGDGVLRPVINGVTTLTNYQYGTVTVGGSVEGSGDTLTSTHTASENMDLLVSVSIIRVFDSRPFFTTIAYRRRTSGSRALVSANLHTTETNFDEFGWDCTTTQIEDGSKIQLLEWI